MAIKTNTGSACVSSAYANTLNSITASAALFKSISNLHLLSVVKESNSRTNETVQTCLRHGFVVYDVNGKTLTDIPSGVFAILNRLYGFDITAFNQTFHKSYNAVKSMSPLEYYMQQLLHYMTTYGADYAGVDCPTYIPNEKLDLGDIKNNVNFDKLTVIRIVPDDIAVQQIDKFAMNVATPSQEQVAYFRYLVKRMTLPIDQIKSFELQIMAINEGMGYPENELTALRFIVYKMSGSTFVIKNAATIHLIKNASYRLSDAEKQQIISVFLSVSATKWARIFYRYKPIFLAMRQGISGLKPLINRIRRLAVDFHEPLPHLCLQNLVELAGQGNTKDFDRVISRASNAELVKLLNAIELKYGNRGEHPSVFNIRNGRTFVKNTNGCPEVDYDTLSTLFSYVVAVLRDRLADSVKGKIYYIPSYIDYAAPHSMKQYTGAIPWGTRVHMDTEGDACVVGIQWFNQKNNRIDLDLHLHSKTEHFGWNGGFASKGITFTGDMTDAPLPLGAAEAFCFEKGVNDNYILSVSQFLGEECEFKFAVDNNFPVLSNYGRHQFTFKDPVFAPIPLKFAKGSRDMTIGMFVDAEESGKKDFVIYGGSLNHSVVPRGHYETYVDGMEFVLEEKLLLRDLLTAIGAHVVDTLPDNPEENNIVDLSPEGLTSTTLMDVIEGRV